MVDGNCLFLTQLYVCDVISHLYLGMGAEWNTVDEGWIESQGVHCLRPRDGSGYGEMAPDPAS